MLVVGASSGIGRALAVGAGSAGAKVALAARRLALVEEAAAEIRGAGGEARRLALRRDRRSRLRAPGRPRPRRGWAGSTCCCTCRAARRWSGWPTTPAELWHQMLATNLVGAALVVRGALAHLREADDPVVVVTTHSMGTPWPWLGVYGATKAALAELARALRSEEPRLRVLCVAVGNTVSSFADNWDPEVAAQAFEQWAADGLLRYEVLQCPRHGRRHPGRGARPGRARRAAHRGRGGG